MFDACSEIFVLEENIYKFNEIINKKKIVKKMYMNNVLFVSFYKYNNRGKKSFQFFLSLV